MRIQILELPRKTVDDEIPFTLVFSECLHWEYDALIADKENIKRNSGARSLFVTQGSVVLGPDYSENPQETSIFGNSSTKGTAFIGDVHLQIEPDRLEAAIAETRAILERTEGKLPQRPPYHEDDRLVEIVGGLLYAQAREDNEDYGWPTWEQQRADIKAMWVDVAFRRLKEKVDAPSQAD